MKGAQNLKQVKEQQALDLSVLRISHYLLYVLNFPWFVSSNFYFFRFMYMILIQLILAVGSI